MSDPIKSHPSQDFENRRVDNEGFFQTIEERLPTIISTRLELKELLASMKNKKIIRGVTDWTAEEQRNFFQKVREEIVGTGILFSSKVREKIQEIIEQEIWREINDEGMKFYLQDGGGNVIIPNMNNSQEFLQTSFLTNTETTIIPLDLHLTVNETETIEDAQKKLNRYWWKYNALILINPSNRPLGIVRSDALTKHKEQGNDTLSSIPYIPDVSGYYMTSSAQAKESMQQYDINILPIIDTNTGILIGILTGYSLERKGLQYYSTVSLTELSLEYLKSGTKPAH